MQRRRSGQLFLFVAIGMIAFSATNTIALAEQTDQQPAAQPAERWNSLSGKWEPIEFGGEGAVEIDDDTIRLAMGSPLTGVRWKGDLPRENYEIELEARRVEGLDFFCALTFPVAKDHVSFVLGGWGGGVVGISSVDGYDASENDTTMYQQFKMNQWYKIRCRVTAGAVQCWIDDKISVDQPRTGHTFDIRFEMDPCTPLGLANFQCRSEVRDVRMRTLTRDELRRAAEEINPEATVPSGDGE